MDKRRWRTLLEALRCVECPGLRPLMHELNSSNRQFRAEQRGPDLLQASPEEKENGAHSQKSNHVTVRWL